MKSQRLKFHCVEARITTFSILPILVLLYTSLLFDAITTNFVTLRVILFDICIASCVVELTCVYPYLLLHCFGFHKFSVLGVILHFIVMVFMGSFITTNYGFMSVFGLLDKLAVIGIFITAILSGYSAVSVPLQRLNPFTKTYSKEEETEVLQQLRLLERRNEIESELYQNICQKYLMINESNRVQMKRKGTIGTIGIVYGFVMSLYCIYKLLNCTIHVIGLTRSDGSSWITKFLNVISKFVHIPIDWDIIGQYLSFVMVGIMVLTGIRGLTNKSTRIITKFDKLKSKKLKGSIIIGMCYFITIYSLSFTIMVQSNLISNTSIIHQAFSHMDYDSYSSFSDRIFLLTSVVTFCIFYMKHKYGVGMKRVELPT
ncbi:Abscisic acid G-protein coupled receptor-like domain-containing protein [Entamoeba marina]